MNGQYKDYVDIKDALTNLLEAGYNFPMIETVLEQMKLDAASKVVKSYKEVENLPSVAANKWIPVTERLPDERDWYITVFKEKDTGCQLIPRVADYIGENNWRIIDEDGLGENYRDILECVAWMPLPEPYKAEEKRR